MNPLITSEEKAYLDFQKKYSKLTTEFLDDWNKLSYENQERFLQEMKPMLIGFMPYAIKYITTGKR